MVSASDMSVVGFLRRLTKSWFLDSLRSLGMTRVKGWFMAHMNVRPFKALEVEL
jgi:hypothetical protein